MKKLLAAVLLPLYLSAIAAETAVVPVYDATDFYYHVRYSLSGTGSHVVNLSWPDDADSSRYIAVTEITVSSFDDPLFPAKVCYQIRRTRGNDTSVFAEGDFECRAEQKQEFSMVLRRTASGASLSLGDREASAIIAVPFSGDSIFAEAAKESEIRRHSLIIRSIGKREKAPFENREALMSYLAASSDPMETVWEYLDRDIDPAEARLGGKYTIATVLAPGGYDIIYIDGPGNSPGSWKCLDIKGKLKDTTFNGHYDLHWLAAPGHTADNEASATLDIGGEVLELTFPTLRSRLRFRKQSH